ncbi:hypothetical protein TVAG_411100 [Trichomonas vaginalis G3]|uniref:Uncharacterized protein n=1 Tax=Trichomonas vaginalis (strain ATCC PRA-98 / G3) TaxID=412133 RepID=A2DXL5_TRIV3|nr:spectrin binding [Trichomonas vaginalis G3]EAY14844.1 hypothetical protein TVAG_411100 [Trichomonas vaginalis G3]KAI5541175.1 spectrin binding [Trichomonas vaginalis G3]|eukprot:XP_001327067.1 hypothetical protein [Trichomonas vaginalis G3]
MKPKAATPTRKIIKRRIIRKKTIIIPKRKVVKKEKNINTQETPNNTLENKSEIILQKVIENNEKSDDNESLTSQSPKFNNVSDDSSDSEKISIKSSTSNQVPPPKLLTSSFERFVFVSEDEEESSSDPGTIDSIDNSAIIDKTKLLNKKIVKDEMESQTDSLTSLKTDHNIGETKQKNPKLSLQYEKSFEILQESDSVSSQTKRKKVPPPKLDISFNIPVDVEGQTKPLSISTETAKVDISDKPKSSIDTSFDEKLPKANDPGSPHLENRNPHIWSDKRSFNSQKIQRKAVYLDDDNKYEKRFDDLSAKINEINEKLSNLKQKSDNEITTEENISLFKTTDSLYMGESDPSYNNQQSKPETKQNEEEECIYFEDENLTFDPPSENYEKYNDLISDIKSGRITAVQAFIMKEHPNVVTSRGSTILHVASHYDQLQIVNLILRMNEINIDAVDSHGMTALGRACENGTLEIVKLLIDNGARTDIIDGKGHKAIDATNKNNFTILARETASGNYENVKYLLKHGATPNIVSNKGTVAIDGVNENGETLLHIKSRDGDIKAIKFLIKNDANACIRDKNGQLPIHIASKHKDKELRHKIMDELSYSMTKSSTDFIDLMLRDNKLFIRNKSNYIKKAIDFCANEVIPFLLNNGCECDTIDEDGCSLLHYAAKVPNLNEEKQFEMTKVIEILEVNGSLFCFDKKGRTPLHYAAANNYQIICRYFIGKDTRRLTLQDAEGNTPFDLATTEQMKKFITNLNSSMKKSKEMKEQKFLKLHSNYLTPEDIIEMIKLDYNHALKHYVKSGKLSLKYKTKEKPHSSLLHISAMYDSIRCFFFLISHKADIMLVDDDNHTAFQVAAINNAVSVLTAFIDLDFKPEEKNSEEMLSLTGEMNESYYVLDSYIDYTNIVYQFFKNYDVTILTQNYNFFTKLIFFDMCILNQNVAENIMESNILNINAVNTFGENAIYHIVKYGDDSQNDQHELIKKLVKFGCNPNAQRLDGNTPLHAALISKNLGFIETLISCGGDDTISNDNGTIVRNMIE